MAWAFFLMRQTMRGIPKPLLEVILDGAKPFQVLSKVVVPLIKPFYSGNLHSVFHQQLE